jgi:penicillin-binding protein 1A
MRLPSIPTIVRFLWLGFLAVVGLVIFFGYGIAINVHGLFGGMPGIDKLANPTLERASVVYSADNQILGKYFRENREDVTFEQISPNLINALYATEDVRFDEHSGIDFKGTFSIVPYLIIGKKRGSSTITQQLAKNLFQTRDEEYSGHLAKWGFHRIAKVIVKIKEWMMAIRLERAYTKREIITMYLNTVDFGSNAYGIKVAAKTFFGTSPQNLTIEQSAVLVGVLKGPTIYSPILNPKRCIARRNTVLEQMYKYDYLKKEEYNNYLAMPIGIENYKVENANDGLAPYFRAELRKDLITFCKEADLDLYSDGLKIYTTIDSRMQRYAEAALEKHMKSLQNRFFNYWKGKDPWVDENGKIIPNFIENAAKRTSTYKQLLEQYNGNADSVMAELKKPVKRRLFSWKKERYAFDTTMSFLDSIRYTKRFLHAGLLSIDPKEGHIKAWVGGINFRAFKYDHVRQGRRQPGSTFKPFVYAAAIDNLGFTPCNELVDAPITITDESTGKSWTPKNSDGVYTGERKTLRLALAQSINTIAVQLIQKVNPQTVVDYAHRLGIESPLDPVPALALGVSDVSLFELVGAYSTFANKGEWIKPFYISRIDDRQGNTIRTFTPERKEVINEGTANLMLYMLMGSSKERNGTALGLYKYGKTLYRYDIAAKTGTTSNYSDGWFMGITRGLVTGIWVGGDDRSIHFHTSADGQGSRMAMPIWSYYMDAVYDDETLKVKQSKKDRFVGVIEKVSKEMELDCDKVNKPVADSLATDSSGTELYQPKGDDIQ